MAEFEEYKATCCVMAKEKLLFEPDEEIWYHYDDRFDQLFYCPWCGENLREMLENNKPIEDETVDAIETLYANRALDDESYLTITGKNVREIIAELESAKRCNTPILTRLVESGIRGIIVDDGKGWYVYSMFLPKIKKGKTNDDDKTTKG